VEPDRSPYSVVPNSLNVGSKGASLQVVNKITAIVLQLDLFALKANTLRLKINEASPIKPRFEPPLGDVLIEEPKTQR
jgi:hypothetical protein